ncbi:MAG: hypothetical protein NTW32_20700 [Chloroflexi bacterium]|nr:hypothetical protein [Chloroflexota bacterium]
MCIPIPKVSTALPVCALALGAGLADPGRAAGAADGRLQALSSRHRLIMSGAMFLMAISLSSLFYLLVVKNGANGW